MNLPIVATTQPRGKPVNTISGRIVLKDSGAGIPDLLVSAYDVGDEAHADKLRKQYAGNGELASTAWQSFGSVLTNADGEFVLASERDVHPVAKEKNEPCHSNSRANVFLVVLAPEENGKDSKSRVVYSSLAVRRNAGQSEQFLIRLTDEELKNAGFPIPQNGTAPDDDSGDEHLKTFERQLKSGKRFFEQKSELLNKYVEQEHEKHAAERTATFSSNVKEELSRVPQGLRESRNFVADGESIKVKVFDNTASQVQETFNGASKKPTSTGFIYLTQAQLADYAQFIQGDEYVLPGAVVEQEILPRLFGGNAEEGSANDFLMDHPTVRLCVRNIRGDIECKAHTHEAGDTPALPAPTTDGGGTLLVPATSADVPAYIARQMEHVTAPEGVVNLGVEGKDRATAGEIGKHIGELQFGKGPADMPAYFDFHTLHIAFEHVWKEATDQGILAQGEALYDEVVGTGKRPTGLKDLLAGIQSTVRFLKNEPQHENPIPPVEVIFEFPDAVNVWDKMTSNEQKALIKLAHAMLGKYADVGGASGANTIWKDYLSGTPAQAPRIDPPYIDKEHLLDRGGFEVISVFRQKGQRILDTVLERVEDAHEVKTDYDRYKKASELAESLESKLKERYSFTYFAADGVERSINFGVVLTYRQEWAPIDYRAGELVRTIPLAPKEIRKYSKRTVVKKSRSEKEIEDNLRIIKTDTSETGRAESEIMNKAFNKNTFTLNTSSTFDIPLSDKIKIGNTVTTNMTNEAQRESNQTKKDFRESVVKAAQEYKNERRVEISTESSSESETTESGEISNPNDELTVTYLFYELQRQFRVNERLHRMRPVVLVAQELPAPHEIDDDWIVRHDWMLKRALMDDSFVPAFDCVFSLRGDKLMLAELKRSELEQRKIVRDLRQNVKFYTDETGRMSRLMQAAINKEADVVEDRDFWDGIPILGDRLDAVESAVKGVGSLLGFGKGDDPKEANRIRREGVKDAYERAERERRELMGRLERETGVLNGLTKEVAAKQKDINQKEVFIARLKNHLKDNILHYMQAIWTYEHPDQRFFRLFNTKVPQLSAQAAQYNLRIKTAPAPAAMFDEVVNLGRTSAQRKARHPFYCAPVMTVEEKTLEEVAELDNLLGFKGNYMIFPLRKSNVLTDFMMAPYVDSEFGLLDPDALGNWSMEDFEKLYCCLKEKLGDKFGEVEPALREFYRQLLTDPLRPGELISVPTGSLFIEALPGEHPVLENFKALHRAVDVKKVQAEVRKLELENIRYAARLLSEEREDPDIERKIVVEGNGVLVTPEPN